MSTTPGRKERAGKGQERHLRVLWTLLERHWRMVFRPLSKYEQLREKILLKRRSRYLGDYDLFWHYHDLKRYKIKIDRNKTNIYVKSWMDIFLLHQFSIWLFRPPFATIAMQSISGFQRHSPLNTIKSTYLIFNSFGAPKLLFSMVVHIIVTFHCWSIIPIDKTVNFWCAHGKSHGHGQNIKSVPVTVAMGNAYYVFFLCPW